MWIFYASVEVFVAIFTIFLLRHYASSEVSPWVYFSTGLAWMTAMSVVALVPIDVWATMSKQTNPYIGTLWAISYWITFFLTWLVIPIAQGYVDAGDFTVSGRLRTAIRDNLMFWLIIIVVGIIGICLLIFAAHFNLSDLPGYGIALSNAFGLLASVFLLGFGLVTIPKTLWFQASPDTSLKREINKLGKLAEKVDDACFELSTVCTVVQATQQQMGRRDELRKYMEIIYNYAEAESPIRPSNVAGPGGSIDMDSLNVDDLDYGTSMEGLATLRRRLKRAVSVFKGTQKQYCTKVMVAQELEDICKSRRTRDYEPPRASGSNQAVWTYKCLMRPWVLRLAALSLAALSLCLIFAEATIGAGRHPDLSPFSILVHAKQNRAEISLQLLVLIPLVYMCTCTYYSLFRLGIFRGLYFMVPGCTSPYSLLVNAALMCRFAPPLCYNFMHVIHVDDPKDGDGHATTFAKKMQAMDLIPLLGSDFNKWFPLVLVFYCGALTLATVTGCGCLDRLIPGRLAFDEEEPDDEHSERGRTLLRKEQEARSKGLPVGSALGLDALYGPGAAHARAELGRPPSAAGQMYRVQGQTRGSPTRGSSSSLDADADGGPSNSGSRNGGSWWPWGRAANRNSAEQSLLGTPGNNSSANVSGRGAAAGATSLDDIFSSLSASNTIRGGNARIDDE